MQALQQCSMKGTRLQIAADWLSSGAIQSNSADFRECWFTAVEDLIQH